MATTLPALATDSDTVETATTEPVTSRTGPDTDTESSADENTTARADSESVIDDDDPVGDETSSATDEDGPPDGGSDDESNEASPRNPPRPPNPTPLHTVRVEPSTLWAASSSPSLPSPPQCSSAGPTWPITPPPHATTRSPLPQPRRSPTS